ncbi:acyl-CoA dehydrogenase family protein [Actinoplanes sp. CA-015351]|uniref:acyl-CoA dehydrogenase family protein n=1 Tax=Actinoplanes sp. CA-015351 TaxID=3239897 RepID=UPI003D99F7C6
MDFRPDETQKAISRLAAEVVAGSDTPERLWKDLGQAGLLTLGAPEGDGGAGLGIFETTLVLTEIGRHAATTPAIQILGDSVTLVPDHGVRLDGPYLHEQHPFAIAAACALADGALAGALDLTAGHIRTRHQFGKPLATFQAVAQQIADVYIASRTLHLAVLTACWRLGTGRPAGEDLAVAAQWLTAEAPPAIRTCHHLHGGLGLMIDYPLHRHTTMIRDMVRFLGGAEQTLTTLGEHCVPRSH